MRTVCGLLLTCCLGAVDPFARLDEPTALAALNASAAADDLSAQATRLMALMALSACGDSQRGGIPGQWLPHARILVERMPAGGLRPLVTARLWWEVAEGRMASVVKALEAQTLPADDPHARALRTLATRDWRPLLALRDRQGLAALHPVERYALLCALVAAGDASRLAEFPAEDPELPAWGLAWLRWHGLGQGADRLMALAQESALGVLNHPSMAAHLDRPALTNLAKAWKVPAAGDPAAILAALDQAGRQPDPQILAALFPCLQRTAEVVPMPQPEPLPALLDQAAVRLYLASSAWARHLQRHAPAELPAYTQGLRLAANPLLDLGAQTDPDAYQSGSIFGSISRCLAIWPQDLQGRRRPLFTWLVADHQYPRWMRGYSRGFTAHQAMIDSWKAESSTSGTLRTTLGLVSLISTTNLLGGSTAWDDSLEQARRLDPWESRLVHVTDQAMPRFQALTPTRTWVDAAIHHSTATFPIIDRSDNFASDYSGGADRPELSPGFQDKT